MNPVLTHPDAIAVGLIRCADDVALSEARAVLADMPHHTDDQIADAARAVMCLSHDEAEWLQAYEALATTKRLELIP